MDHWAVSQLSPAWQAPRSAPCQESPGVKCGQFQLGLSCVTAVSAEVLCV